jgi:hypothetical protein
VGSKALAYAMFGARGTGKTAAVKQLIAREKPSRLLVWDHKHDPSLRDGSGEPITSLGEVARRAGAARFQLRYLVDHNKPIDAQFDLFCRIAWAAGDLMMFVDELPEVTKANRAPPSWRKCVNVGREYSEGGKTKRLTIVGAGQRPAECDKSFIANCDVVRVGRLGDISDAKRIAASWGIRPDELVTLPDLHYVERWAGDSGVRRGVLTFSGAKKKPPKGQPAQTPKGPVTKSSSMKR